MGRAFYLAIIATILAVGCVIGFHMEQAFVAHRAIQSVQYFALLSFLGSAGLLAYDFNRGRAAQA